jgi:hypothetical protein
MTRFLRKIDFSSLDTDRNTALERRRRLVHLRRGHCRALHRRRLPALHVSRLHHGHDSSESAVHSDYETTMMDRNVGKLVDGVNALLQQNQRVKAADLYSTGAEAADHMVTLMKQVIEDILKPEDVITSWKNAHGATKYTTMWNDLGARTCQCIVAGARAMALFWESAWHEGRKNLPPLAPTKIHAVGRPTLLQKYQDDSQFESNWIKDMHLP